MADTARTDEYAVSKPTPDAVIAAPELAYRPPRPRTYRPRIGLIGCGGITEIHLQAYVKAGYEVVALTDLDRARAEARQAAFYPQATIEASAASLLQRSDIDVVDVALHPRERGPILLEAIAAGKHVLSQKPFVVDLDLGEKIVAEAQRRGVKVAVNQNGRWAPYVAWLRQAVTAGLVGEVTSVDMMVSWDHNWVVGKPFDHIPQLVLYDFAIHWFDMLRCYTRGMTARRTFATLAHATGQRAKPPLLAQVGIDFDSAQASMQFRASTLVGPVNRTVIVGTKGTLMSDGPSLSEQSVKLYTAVGQATPTLEGTWFSEGFEGTMGELLCAIEEDREPFNSAADNLESLSLAFAAIASTDSGQPVTPGSVRRLEDRWLVDA